MICNNCGNEISENDKFCKYCGMNTEFNNNDNTNGLKGEKKKMKFSANNSYFFYFAITPIIFLLLIVIGFFAITTTKELGIVFLLFILIALVLLIYILINHPKHERKQNYCNIFFDSKLICNFFYMYVTSLY